MFLSGRRPNIGISSFVYLEFVFVSVFVSAFASVFDYLAPLLLVLLLLGLEPLLVPDELLLHQQVVLDPLLLQKPQTALKIDTIESRKFLYTLVLGIGSSGSKQESQKSFCSPWYGG